MNENQVWETPHWYLIHTHPKQENRAEGNLKFLSSETYLPMRLTERVNPFTDQTEYAVRPLFPGYLFARFKVNDSYHKVAYTRGVRAVVSFSDSPAIVGDDVVELIRSRQSRDGLVRIQEPLRCGDLVVIKQGPLKNLVGVFGKNTSDAERVMLLLQAVEYQACVIVNRRDLAKADLTATAVT
jgi:transcriptional antiterminator RfaH